MTDVVAQIFGYAILAISAGLAAWEFVSNKRPTSDTLWLYTPSRFRRRIIMAVLLACVGVLLLAETHGLLELNQISHLLIYVSALSALSLTLFILSIRDLGDMSRSAEKQAILDLQSAIEEKKKRDAESTGGEN